MKDRKMKVWVVWKRYCQSFDIVADESLCIVGIFLSEESAFMKTEELDENETDPNISYHYEVYEVEE